MAEGFPSLAFERMHGEWVVFSDYQLLFQVQVSQHRKERAARQAKRKPFTDMSLSSLYSVLRAESHGLFFRMFSVSTASTAIEQQLHGHRFPREIEFYSSSLARSLDNSPLGILSCSAMQGRPMMRGRHCITTFRSSCTPLLNSRGNWRKITRNDAQRAKKCERLVNCVS